MLRFIFVLLIATSLNLFGQELRPSSVQWWHLSPNAINNLFSQMYGYPPFKKVVGDSVNALSADNITITVEGGKFTQKVFADTTVLKLASIDSIGKNVYLRQYSAANTNGGGEFVFVSSGVPNGITTFEITGGYLVRSEWITNPGVYKSEWLPTQTGVYFSTFIKEKMNSGDVLELASDVYTGGLSYDMSSSNDSLTIRGSGQHSTIFSGGLTITSGKTIIFEDLTFVSSGGEGAITGWDSGANFVLRNVTIRTTASYVGHAILIGGKGSYTLDNVTIEVDSSSSGVAIRGGYDVNINNLKVNNGNFALTLKAADGDTSLTNVNVNNYIYGGKGVAIHMESTDEKAVRNININNVTVSSRAKSVFSSKTYDDGLAIYNGIIENINISNVVAPKTWSNSFVIDGIKDLSFNNIYVDSTNANLVFVADGTGVLSYYMRGATNNYAASGQFNSLSGLKFAELNGQMTTRSVYKYSKKGINPALEEYSNGFAEGAIFDAEPLEDTFGSWKPLIEKRTSPTGFSDTQNVRVIDGSFRYVAGTNLFNTGIRKTILSNNNAQTYTGMWQDFAFGNGFNWWGLGYDSLKYAFYVDTFRKDFVFSDGIDGTWYNKTFKKLNIISSRPGILIADPRYNLKHTATLTAATDTSAILIDVNAVEPFVELTNRTGSKVKITSEVVGSAGATTGQFLVVYINGVRRKLEIRAD